MPIVSWLLSKRTILFSGLFLLCIFFLAVVPTDNADTFYHVKAGEIFLHHGILFKDIFSFTAQGREWFPYEWFFEVVGYLFQLVFGYGSLGYFSAFVVSVQICILLVFLRKYFKLPIILAALLCFVYFVSTDKPFLVVRPQIFALLFFTITVISILWYLKTGKNLLWIALFSILLWVNSHTSAVFAGYLFVSYAILSFIIFKWTKKELWYKKAKTLGIYSIVAVFITVLPPLGVLPYRQLFLFSSHIGEITRYFAEWVPLYMLSNFTQMMFTIPLVLSFIAMATIFYKRKTDISVFFLSPLLVFLLLPYLSYRNTIFGFVVLLLFWAYITANLQLVIQKTSWQKFSFFAVSVVMLAVYAYILFLVKAVPPHYQDYPSGAADFLLTHHVSGSMFNTMPEGGYLMYRLYPAYKVFIDLRADVYLCCEMPKYQVILDNVMRPDDTSYDILTKEILDPYHISFVVLPIKNDFISQKIAHVLTVKGEKEWELVFWDDQGAVFVRKDGKNDALLQSFGAPYVTPFEGKIYRSGHEQEAVNELQRMKDVKDSAVTEDALGDVFLAQKKLNLAEGAFQRAIQLDATSDFAYIRLGDIFAENKEYERAVDLYKKALQVNSERVYTYIRLGEVYAVGFNDTASAIAIWQQGSDHFSDPAIEQEFSSLLEQAQAGSLPLLQQ